MRASPLHPRHLATALGLVLPLLALPAVADPRAWVDPPKATGKPAEGTPAAAPEAAAPKVAPPRLASPAPAAAAPAYEAAVTHRRHAASAKQERARERIAASPRHRHSPPRSRLADTPAVTPSMGPVPVAAAPAGRAEAAQALATEYLSAVSSPGEAMVGATPRFYSTRVRFYGRSTTLAALLDEKRGFVRRWPERRYAARAFSTQCTRDGSTCIVRAIVDFRAANPQRGAVSRGASELVLEVSFAGQRPVIVAESGRVIHRDGPSQDRAETLAGAPGRG
ncbi:hypothetical protein [Methylobacterium persicinum]|uniref:Uncharacterized protein n=1 Tax=Methylobacterium persicinum TaxID=374426 RepID=A0ABU0HN73_9HYPH|nr:hypothetical protein [Methylobacterium persicinum]MDQ0443780.1 hypothetical protein [Methylobacterium persicinum]GJE37471.1 hypothetical protein KHHGKMAE_1530 [Methylobacterium persicinum]